jgi:Cu/Ag efflux pump CusA
VILLYAGTRSVVPRRGVLLAVPFSLVGAVWLLALLGYHLSLAVWVGMIALAGLDAETGWSCCCISTTALSGSKPKEKCATGMTCGMRCTTAR